MWFPRFGRTILLLMPCGIPVVATAAHPIATPDQYALHPALELSLFAQEPDVIDPVAITFDELGRAYVVEMRDYPYGFGPQRRPGGTIRRVEDTDHDGRADRSVVFATDLSFPTGIALHDGGAFVAAPPEILFLKDTDGDGRADVREVMFTGFRVAATDSNMNGLRWGLDNWIHGVNGGNDGTIRSPRWPLPEPLSLRGRDFRFDPRNGKIELTTSTGGGYGLAFDAWDHSFTPHNINHLQQRIISNDYFNEIGAAISSFETTHSISDHGEMARIFPISVALTRPNHPEQAGHFSSSGGMGFIGHRGWPKELQNSVLVCDVVGNLVHRDELVSNGPILTARRAAGDEAREFFASRDNSFRPVGLEQGPDGALYLLDMQRDVIEHPDYIPRKLLEKQDVRAGDDRGRIYRIVPRNTAGVVASIRAAGTEDKERPGREALPGQVTSRQWVTMLGSPNPWTQQTAQRLLVAKRESSLVGELQRAVETLPDAEGRVRALWVLHAWGDLDEPILLRALEANAAGLRENAVRLAETRLGAAREIRAAVIRRLKDENPAVRFRAALALSLVPPVEVEAVSAFLLEDHRHVWSRRAGLAAAAADAGKVLDRLLQTPVFVGEGDAAKTELVRDLAAIDCVKAIVPRGASDILARAVDVVRKAELGAAWKAAVLDGLAQGVRRRQISAKSNDRDAMEALDAATDFTVRTAAWRLMQALGLPESPGAKSALVLAMRTASDRGRAVDERLGALDVLALGRFSEVGPTLFGLLEGVEPMKLQQASFEVLRDYKEPQVAQGLIESWRSLAPALRPAVVNLLVYQRAFQDALLTALENGALSVGELNLDLEHRRQLLRKTSEGLRQRAARFMSDEEYSNRSAVAEEWLARLPAKGTAANGRAVFERICAQCHLAQGLGHSVGPDLTDLSHRSVEDLVSNILDPNMALNPLFVAFMAELADGEIETGILGPENAESVTLLQALGRKVEIPRARIKSLRSEGRSLMPEGLEAGMTPQDLRDLVAFLQQRGSPDPGATER